MVLLTPRGRFKGRRPPPEDAIYIDLDDGSSADQSASLIAQLAAIPDGTEEAPVRVITPHATPYRVDLSVVLSGREWITVGAVDGQQTLWYSDFDGIELGLLRAPGVSDRLHWYLLACTGVTLCNMKVRGPNDQRDPDRPAHALYTDARAFEHAYAMAGACDRCTFRDLEMENVWGDGVYMGNTGAPNTDCVVRDVNGWYTGRQQLGIVNVLNCLIEDVDIRGGGRSGLDIEPIADSSSVIGLTVRRVTMGSKSFPFRIGGDDAMVDIDVDDILIEDCTGIMAVSSHPAVSANPHGGGSVTVRGHNDIRQRSTWGMDFGWWEGHILIEDCVVSSGTSTATSYGVHFSGSFTGTAEIRNSHFNGVTGAVGVGGADQLFLNDGSGTVEHCGNTWNRSGSNDGSC